MEFRSSSREGGGNKKTKNPRILRANHKAVPMACKAQVLPPQTHLSHGEQQALRPFAEGW